ncbi:8-amino-7-oxononanoate synthase [Nodosilinea sp. LEGE 07088]|uniref:8-amino-7-oxononanoate synthase n=1 Tax=Nodosilinea sp. LEGE 07088 TaxID=2777968 RepID=UPI00187E651B|nr:8-amino-7-oxononanoate synthase [Nodosilinea sp. LEGE 07088]MBE9139834.1 8-amino-7-oxononanoate synthase [Nodosilinea sp. LEGE 07088]
MGDSYAWLDKSLAALHRAHRYRSVQAIDGMAGATIQRQGQTLVNFASNDYLGLASDPRLAAAAIAAIRTYGTGSTGSRLLSGHRDLHRQLECAIAALKGTDDAMVFSSGYLANLGAIAALVGSPDLVLGDDYNHSSLRAGGRVSGATVLNYRHGDMTHLQSLLGSHRHQHRRCLITTDSVFSMDGDLCPLSELLDLAQTYDAMVLVDEAHATGVFGQRGSGLVEHLGCGGRPVVTVGTLSKALGSLGGYVAGSRTLIDFLRNRAPGWIYTTGLSPADTAAALAATQIIQQEPQRRQRLWHHVNAVIQRLDRHFAQASTTAIPLRRLPSASPIICLQPNSAAATLKASDRLQQMGLWVAAVRPPTVPTSRLRFTLMATHQPDHIDQLLEAISVLMHLDH